MKFYLILIAVSLSVVFFILYFLNRRNSAVANLRKASLNAVLENENLTLDQKRKILDEDLEMRKTASSQDFNLFDAWKLGIRKFF